MNQNDRIKITFEMNKKFFFKRSKKLFLSDFSSFTNITFVINVNKVKNKCEELLEVT